MLPTISQNGQGKANREGKRESTRNLILGIQLPSHLLAHGSSAKPGASNVQKQLGEEGGAGILMESSSWGVPESICGLWLDPSMEQG